MRYRDFNLTEEQLDEVKMSTANLTRLAKNINALAGIEFEMYVPNVGSEEDELDPEPDYDQDESFPSGARWDREVINFFRGGDTPNSTGLIQRKIDELNENFYIWLEDDFDSWMDSDEGQLAQREAVENYIDPNDFNSEEELARAAQDYMEQNADDIRDELRNLYFEDNDAHFERYLDEEGIGSMSDFANEYGLDWPYWNYPESNRGSIDIETVAMDFADAMGMPAKASGYHGGSRLPGRWNVETDSSLDSPDDSSDGGLEFISPPMPIDEMIAKFDAVMKWANRVGAYTNKTTGLHMNVSIPNYDRSKIDFIKLAVFLGDEYVANQFNRLGTFYAKNVTELIRARKTENPGAVEELFRQMRSGMNTMASRMVMAPTGNKYLSIHPKEGWIEFRSPGGDYITEYENNRDKIVNTLLRMVVAMDIAMDPEKEKEEYARKLNRLFKPTKVVGGRGERQRIEEPLTGNEEDTIKYFAQFSAGTLPRSALKSFIKRAQSKRQEKKLPPEDETLKIPGQTPSRDQEFTGTWEVVSRPTDEVVHTISGIGNAVADAERRAQIWALTTGFNDPIYVRPQMRTRSTGGGIFRAPHTSIFSIVNNHDGEVLLPGQQGTWVYIQNIADNIRHRRNIPRDDIRIIDMEQNRAYMLSGQPASAGVQTPIGGEQSSDANYEIVDRRRVPYTPVFRFIANTDQEASQKFMDWLRGAGLNPNDIDSWRDRYGWRRIEGRPTATPIPGSTQDRINQRLAAQGELAEPEQNDYEVTYTTEYRNNVNTDTSIVRSRNADAAMNRMRASLERAGYTVVGIEARPVSQSSDQAPAAPSEPLFNVRWTDDYGHAHDVNTRAPNANAAMDRVHANLIARGLGVRSIEANPLEQTQTPARGTEDLPPGNTRWLIMDQNDREVYSFVHRSNQGEANVYAANWLRQNGMLGQGEFMVVPAR